MKRHRNPRGLVEKKYFQRGEKVIYGNGRRKEEFRIQRQRDRTSCRRERVGHGTYTNR